MQRASLPLGVHLFICNCAFSLLSPAYKPSHPSLNLSLTFYFSVSKALSLSPSLSLSISLSVGLSPQCLSKLLSHLLLSLSFCHCLSHCLSGDVFPAVVRYKLNVHRPVPSRPKDQTLSPTEYTETKEKLETWFTARSRYQTNRFTMPNA